MRHKQWLKKALSLLMTLAMLTSMIPAAYATEETQVLTGFADLEKTEYTAEVGTALEELGLPEALSATKQVVTATPSETEVDENGDPVIVYGYSTEDVDVAVTWNGYDAAMEGEQTLTASAEGYVLAEGVEWPTVTVTLTAVEGEEDPAPVSEEEPVVDEAVVAVQAMIDALDTEVSSDEEAEALEAAIVAVDDAMAELYTEQSTQLDYTNYVAATDALDAYWAEDHSQETLETEEEGAEDTWYDSTATELTIDDKADLLAFVATANAGNNFSGKTVKLTDNIDLGGMTWTPIKNFLGTFDGDSKTISNFHLDATKDHAGFFYKVNFGNGTAIKDLTLSDITATVGNYYVGALAYFSFAVQDNITIKNFTVTTTASEAKVGGYAGWVEWGHIRNCTIENMTVNAENGAGLIGGLAAVLKADSWLQYNNIDVKGMQVTINDTDGQYAEVGGLVGQTQTGHDAPVFTNCDITGLDVTATGKVTVGGFIARPGAHTTAKNCTTQGKIDVTGVISADEAAGGFFGNLGWNNNESSRGGHKLTNCSANVDITTKVAPAGGFVGSATNEQNGNMAATFANCSAAGDVTCVAEGSADIGGFAGDADRGTYSDCSVSGTVTNNGTGKDNQFIGEILSNNVKIINYIAQVGTTKYGSLKEALEACTNGETVTLLNDIVYYEDDIVYAHGGATGFGNYDEYNPSIIYVGGTKGATPAENQPSDVNVVIDLNGKTITSNADAYMFLFMDNCKVTFKDSSDSGRGAVINNSTNYPAIWSCGTDTIVTIESGKYQTASPYGLIHATHSGDLVIEGGEFSTTADDASLLLMINSQKYNNPNYFLVGVATLTVKGGTFEDFNPEKIGDDYGASSIEDIKFVDGVAPGYEVNENDDGSYGVKEWDGEIHTKEDLLFFADAAKAGDDFSGKTVKLMADIDMEWTEWYPFNFYGTLEGNNHTIKNLTYIPNSDGRMGFFQSFGGKISGGSFTLDGIKGTVPANGRFGGFARYLNAPAENVHVKNIEVTTTDTLAWVGGFTTYTAGGSTNNCSVENLTVNAQAGADLIAGFISLTSNRQLYQNCTVDGFKVTINDTDSSGCGVGGFVGQTQTGWNNPKFENDLVKGIDVTASGLVDVGGFIAWPGAHTEYANNCHTQGKINAIGVTSADCFVGGFFGNLGWNCDLGYMGHVVTDCSADVDIISGGAPAGGFVGSATNSNNQSMYATFNNCSASGDVSNYNGPAGGFAGDADRGVYNNCSASGNVIGTTYAGGFIGHIYDTNIKYDSRYPAGTRDYLADAIAVADCETTGSVSSPAGKAAGIVGYIGEGTTISMASNSWPEGLKEYNSYEEGIVQSGVVKIGATVYKTLTEAVGVANQAGKTVTIELLDNITQGEQLTITGNIIISGEYKITWAEGYTGTLFNVAEDASLTMENVTIDGENEFTFYNDTTTVENGQNWYTRFANVGEEDKAVNADVIVNAGSLTLDGAKIQNVTVASTGDNGKTANTETGGFYLMYNDDLALIKSNGGTVTMDGASITGNAGMVLNAINAETAMTGATINGNMGAGNKGGIIIANGGTMSMDENTSICNNKAMARSATILGVINGAEVTFSGKMENNKHIGVGSNTAGAMVVLEGASQFVMNGGSISNNIGGRAGAIASRWVGGSYGQHEEESFVLNAGTITDNTASNDSWNGASVFLRSPATIGEGMEIEGNITVNAAPGALEITGGEFTGSLTVADGLTAEISGGTFNYDPTNWCVDGYAPEQNTNGTWTVELAKLVKVEVEAIPGTWLTSYITVDNWADLEAALGANTNLPVKVTLNEDIVLEKFLTITGDKTVELNLNGHSITRATGTALYVNGENTVVTINGEGTVKSGTAEVLYVNAGTVKVMGGTFTSDHAKGPAVYVINKGQVEINGGTFSNGTGEFVLNEYDKTRDATSIVVKGGMFKNFDPKNNAAEGANTNFCAPNYTTGEADAEGWYTVVPAENFEIWNKADLLEFAAMVNGGDTFAGKTVKLMADIDLAGINWTPIGNDVNYFMGTFDGGSHTISNMTIDIESEGNVFAGLFGGIKKATVKNLTMETVSITAVGAKVRAAAVVGIAHSNSENRTDATINFENITVDGCTINAEAKGGSALVGGVVGYSYPANMKNIAVSDLTIDAKAEGNEVRAAAINGYVCGQNISNNGNTRAPMTVDTFDVKNVSITADAYTVFAGGYAPYTYYGYITLQNGAIDGLKIKVDAHEAFVGGLVGYFWRSDNGHTVEDVTITNIDFDVTTDYLGETRIGGVVGTSQSPNTKYTDVSVSGKIVERCSDSDNPVNYHAKVGGFVARTYEYAMQTYTNCVADVDVTGSNVVGGFVGNHNSTVSYVNCEAKGDVTGDIAGGFAGRLTEHGYTTDVTFDGCKASGTVTGTNVAGGFIGSTANHGWAAWAAGNGTAYGKNITIKDCVASATVTTVNNTGYCAGVVGEAKVAEGKELKMENTTYTVQPPYYPVDVAKIGDVQYKTLSAAITAAKANDTITLLANVTENVTIDKSLTIDGANFKYTGGMSVSGNTTALTVKNVNFVDYTDNYAITTNRISSVTVEDCTLNGYDGFLYANKSTPTVNIKNVTMNGGIYGMHWVYGTKATLEKVTMTNVTNGLLIQNYAGKTVEIKNSNICSIEIWERSGYSGVQTFKFEGENTVGTLSDSQYAKYVLAAADATLTAPEGKNVTTNVENMGVMYRDGVYFVGNPVAQIGEDKYESIQAAVAAAQNGDIITVIKDHKLDCSITTDIVDEEGSKYAAVVCAAGKNVTIDLNGKTITADVNQDSELFAVFAADNGGKLILTDSSDDKSGTVKVTATSYLYSMFFVYYEGAKLIVESGNYSLYNLAGQSMIYAQHSNLIGIEGGYFYLDNVGTGTNGLPWIVNVYGQNAGYVNISGGTFNTDVNHQFWANEVKVPETKALKNNGDGTWTVVDAAAYVEELATSANSYSRNVGYATLAEAVAVAKDIVVGSNVIPAAVTLLKDSAEEIEISKALTINKGTGRYVAEKITAAEGYKLTESKTDYIVSVVNGIVENVTTGVQYETVSDALNAAKSGDTVKLVNDAPDAGFLVIPTGVTLDLSGQTLTATGLAAFGGTVEDSTSGNALLKIADKDYLQISSCEQAVLYDSANGGYRFFNYSYVEGSGYLDDNDKLNFWFAVDFFDANENMNQAAYNLLATGESGFETAITLTWVNADGTAGKGTFVFTDEHVKQYGAETMGEGYFYVILNGYETKTDIKAMPEYSYNQGKIKVAEAAMSYGA